MNNAHPSLTLRLFCLSGLLVLLLAGCAALSPAPEPTPTPLPPSATPPPTATPEPTRPTGRVILVAPASVSATEAQAVQATVGELAGSAGLTLDARPELQPADLSADVRLAVLLSTPANLADLLAAAPGTQFIVISGTDLNPAANLSVIRPRLEQQAFLAGYLAVLAASDRRAAGLLPADGPLGAGLQQPFENGGYYYCGRCVPVYAPMVSFPLVANLPAASDAAAWQAAVDTLNQSLIEVIYVAPEAASADLLTALAAKNFILLGGQTPPEQVRSRWMATIEIDTLSALRNLWPRALAGQGGQVINAVPQIKDLNEQFVSPGRQRLIENVVEQLNSGMVAPFSPPAN